MPDKPEKPSARVLRLFVTGLLGKSVSEPRGQEQDVDRGPGSEAGKREYAELRQEYDNSVSLLVQHLIDYLGPLDIVRRLVEKEFEYLGLRIPEFKDDASDERDLEYLLYYDILSQVEASLVSSALEHLTKVV